VTRPNQLILIDGEQCLHRIFGGAFQEWNTGGVWDQTFGMVQNLEFFAFRKQAKIVIALNGRLPTENTNFELPNLNEFLENKNKVRYKLKLNFNNSRPTKNYNNFILPVEIRGFLRKFEFNCLKIVQTSGYHTETICSWLRNGIPNDILPKSWSNGPDAALSGATSMLPSDFFGYKNEYLLQLRNYENSINYYYSPSLILGMRSMTTDEPTYFIANRIIPDGISGKSGKRLVGKKDQDQNQTTDHLQNLIKNSILLDGDDNFLTDKKDKAALKSFHLKLMTDTNLLTRDKIDHSDSKNLLRQRFFDFLEDGEMVSRLVEEVDCIRPRVDNICDAGAMSFEYFDKLAMCVLNIERSCGESKELGQKLMKCFESYYRCLGPGFVYSSEV